MALVERYVTSAAAGGGDGTIGTPWTLSEAIAAATAGDRVNVKADASYARGASDAFAGVGTIAAPVIWRGYKTTIGDADQGRSGNGSLNTANFPTLAYAATFAATVSGAHNVVQGIILTANVSGPAMTLSGAGAAAVGCSVTNASTNVAGTAVSCITGVSLSVIDCDVFQTGASGAAPAVAFGTASPLVQGCRIKSTSGAGILHSAASGTIVQCVIYGCGTHGISTTATAGGAYLTVVGCTIYGCAANGIDIISTFTSTVRVILCHITDNGGYGVDGNAAVAMEMLVNTRTRDNVTAAHLLDAEWTDAVYGAITTDTGAAATDYEDVAALDFRLIRSAPGRDTTAMGQNAGAVGNDYPDITIGDDAGSGRLIILG